MLQPAILICAFETIIQHTSAVSKKSAFELGCKFQFRAVSCMPYGLLATACHMIDTIIRAGSCSTAHFPGLHMPLLAVSVLCIMLLFNMSLSVPLRLHTLLVHRSLSAS